MKCLKYLISIRYSEPTVYVKALKKARFLSFFFVKHFLRKKNYFELQSVINSVKVFNKSENFVECFTKVAVFKEKLVGLDLKLEHS